jgi:hypothetical protein
MSSVSEGACLVRAHSGLAARLGTKRFLRGQYALYAEFVELAERGHAMWQSSPTTARCARDVGAI